MFVVWFAFLLVVSAFIQADFMFFKPIVKCCLKWLLRAVCLCLANYSLLWARERCLRIVFLLQPYMRANCSMVRFYWRYCCQSLSLFKRVPPSNRLWHCLQNSVVFHCSARSFLPNLSGKKGIFCVQRLWPILKPDRIRFLAIFSTHFVH